MAAQLEGEIGFDRGVDLARPALENIPAALGELAAADVLDAFILQDRIDPPIPVA